MSENEDELINKRKELEERLDKIQKDIAHGYSADSEERAIEMENTDVLLEIARVTEEELESINKKLQQIHD